LLETHGFEMLIGPDDVFLDENEDIAIRQSDQDAL
jgi:hypothetical protein